MKLRQTRYVPKRRKNRLVRYLDIFMVIAAAALWLNRGRFNISVSDMLIVSGLVLFALVFSSANRHMEKDLRVEDEHIEKLRENIGKDNYNENVWFFDGGDEKN